MRNLHYESCSSLEGGQYLNGSHATDLRSPTGTAGHRCLSQPCRDVVESDMAAALSRDQASLHSHMFAARTVFIDPAHQQRQPRDERARPSGRAVEAARTFKRTVVSDRRDGFACCPSGSGELSMGPSDLQKLRILVPLCGERDRRDESRYPRSGHSFSLFGEGLVPRRPSPRDTTRMRRRGLELEKLLYYTRGSKWRVRLTRSYWAGKILFVC